VFRTASVAFEMCLDVVKVDAFIIVYVNWVSATTTLFLLLRRRPDFVFDFIAAAFLLRRFNWLFQGLCLLSCNIVKK
jgi:hypothetical protein